jgi:rhodanese-related sulfurtransferase
MATSVRQMMAEANAAVPRIAPAQAKELIDQGDAVVVDVRDALELRSTGKIAGALHIPRGMLEFQADPESPAYNKALDTAKPVILYCASGGRSALAGKTLKDMGYTEVLNAAASRTWPRAACRSSGKLVIPALVAGIHPTMGSGTSSWMDPGHKARDDTETSARVKNAAVSFSMLGARLAKPVIG